jgi:hypothetical protein
MVSSEGAHVAPEGFATVCRAAGVATDATRSDFGTTRRGRGWPILYINIGMCVVSHSIDPTLIPIWWDGFLARPEHGPTSWRGLGPERYVGVFMFCNFYSVSYVYIYMDVYFIFIFLFADVGPQGWEVEMVGESSHQGPVRLPRVDPWVGERQWRDYASVRLADEVRAGQRSRFNDIGEGSSHAL